MHLSDIIIYPVKSLAGIHLKESLVQKKGLQYDRRWMLLDKDGKFLTQREVPEMALIIPEINNGTLSFRHAKKDFGKIEIRINSQAGPNKKVQVWEDEVMAQSVNKEANKWFSEIFEFNCELVRIEEDAIRKNINGKPERNVSFADSQAFLIIGENSLADLNSRLETPILMNRLRPNFVFSGGEPYVEDTWSSYKIGKVEIENVKPCGRCILTTVDQELGKKTSAEPLRTMSTYRKVGNKILFGMLGKVANGQGEEYIKVGDGITCNRHL